MIRGSSGIILIIGLAGLAAAMLLPALGCSGPDSAGPERVVVQHVLVSMTGKLPGKVIKRDEDEARHLALEILERAESGEDFEALVKEYTDDSYPGIYGLANRGAVPQGENAYRREDMVPGFGDLAFGLELDGIGICEFDAIKSPYGFHIIKRLQ